MATPEIPACVERIDVLLRKIEALPDDAARQDVQEIVSCLLDYHGAALARLLRLIASDDGPRSGVAARLARDELVGSLLLLHGVHPDDLRTRVLEALVRVRPFLESHGGNVELVGIEDDVVTLRLQGSCHGCPSSSATLKLRIEQAIYEAAPEIESVRVEQEAIQAPAANGFVAMEKLTLS